MYRSHTLMLKVLLAIILGLDAINDLVALYANDLPNANCSPVLDSAARRARKDSHEPLS